MDSSAFNPADDAFCHLPSNLWPSVNPADPRWFERYWLNAHSFDGTMALGQGIGVYPNRKTADAFALWVTPERQSNLRSAGLGHALRVGPLHSEMLIPGKKWRFAGRTDDDEFSYDLIFEALYPPVPHVLPHGDPGLVSSLPIRWRTFAQTGRISGSIKDGRVIHTIDPAKWWAGRDRSWGVRPGIGGPGDLEWIEVFQKLGWGFLLYWVLFSTPRRQIWYFGTHDPGGGNRHFTGCVTAQDGRVTPIVDVEHEVELDPQSAQFQKARLRIHTSSGIEEFDVSRISTVYLRGGLYDGLNGVYHGTDRGPGLVEGETWHLAEQPEIRQTVTGLNDHASLFEGRDGTGHGIFELHFGT